jgi:hypothetical protein
MRVKTADRLCLDARARAEPTDDLLFHDYYSRTPQIRLTADATRQPPEPETATEVVLDGNDVAKLVECAIRHPSLNMRHAVLTAIWNHPDSFREILRFGLQAPPAFGEIGKIVAEELNKAAAAESAAANPAKPAGETLLPRVPLPVHLRDRDRQ